MTSPVNRGPGERGQQYATHESGSSTQESASGIMAGIKDKTRELASTVATSAEETWDSTRHGVQHAASAVAHTAESAWEEVTDFMRRYPMATFGIGLGLGVLLTHALSNTHLTDAFPRGSHYKGWDEESRQSRDFGRWHNPT